MSDDENRAREGHAGSEVAIEENGDYLVDSTGADSGHHRFRLKESARLTIEIDGTDAFEVYKQDGSLRIDLGSGATERVVLGDALMALLNQFFEEKFDRHVHPTKAGPSGPPLEMYRGIRLSDKQLSDVVMTKKA
jgi:hypothetical protein